MEALRWFDKNFERVIMAFFLAMIAIMMFIDVVGRYVLQHSPLFAQELARYSMITVCFLGIPYGIRYNAHISAEILPELFPKLKWFFELASDVGMFVFGWILITAGVSKIQMLQASGQVSIATGLPMYVMYMILEIGWILCLLRIIQKYILKIFFKSEFSLDELDKKRNLDIEIE
jgi:TRAP-type C4-dicarboxylate transport system permease small subunit